MADASKHHDWKFHHREHEKHWYICSVCGEVDWLAGDKTIPEMLPTECKPKDTKGTLMETMTQPKITGYRQLTEEEVALMNEGKALAEKCGEYIEKLRQAGPCQIQGGPPGTLDQRWINIGATDIQKGFMAVMRGIAQPTTF